MHRTGRPAKYSEEKQAAIAREWCYGPDTQKSVARKYGISVSTLRAYIQTYRRFYEPMEDAEAGNYDDSYVVYTDYPERMRVKTDE